MALKLYLHYLDLEEFLGVLMKEHVEFPRVKYKEMEFSQFHGCSRKTCLEFPWVLVFVLAWNEIAKACLTALQNFQGRGKGE